MKKTHYFYELIGKLRSDNYAYCVSATYPDGDKIEYVEGEGIIWSKTRKLVQLDWTILSSKWELYRKDEGKE
ncbi:hypothetical protein CVD28_00330 [Bacillus sp. M6-12]|uniref:hypothetical protein n=1 Tax=Bacillus sp. M6-12 TaxID=2054166 RepID=UPI000C76DE1E|nr:hypothetical protein [Bacillus sp. M6-12]PLS18882.1 hypothetical protein CVD28_00330 [Bacillus sp. M6-12]